MTSRGVTSRSQAVTRLDPAHQAQLDALLRRGGPQGLEARALGINWTALTKLQFGGTASAELVERVTAALDRVKP